MKILKAFFGLFGLGMLALTVVGCQPNPLGMAPSAVYPTDVTYAGIVENTSVSGLIFSPVAQPGATVNLNPALFGGTATNSLGGFSRIYNGNSTLLKPDGTYIGSNGNALVLGPNTWTCPTGNCKDIPKYRGIGGPNGNYSSDYFLRWAGYKGPDPSRDYSSLQLSWGTEKNLTNLPAPPYAYRGVTFWARGHGSFAVNLVAHNMVDGWVPPPGTTTPYNGWNFYLRRFGGELNGDTEWKEIIVYFDDMVQEYGLAADMPTVLTRVTGLQFDQQAPYTDNFQLDLDYIRFF